MPYGMRNENGEWVVFNKDTGKEVPGGNHGKDRAKARAHLQALYANGAADDKKSAMKEDEAEAGGNFVKPDDKGEVVKKCPACEKEVKPDKDGKCPECGASLTEKESLNLAYAKSLGIVLPDDQLIDCLTVKRVTANIIKGHATLYGDPSKTDVEMEYFDANTDHWMDKIGLPIPLTYDHAQDTTTKAAPVIGQITDWGKDEVGVWYAAQLDRSHKYRKAIDQLIEEGALGTSSDSAPQYITREKRGKSTYLARWPIFAAALTTTPAEPRQFGTLDYFKSIGALLPSQDATADQARDWLESVDREISLLKLYL